MPSKKPKDLWPAEPHTIAKINILTKYLVPYFPIIGRSRRCEFVYVDGFAGPGKYTNHPEGSPLAALNCARKAMEMLGDQWISGKMHFIFIEKEKSLYTILLKSIEPFLSDPRFAIHVIHGEFAKIFPTIDQLVPASQIAGTQQFFFVDPFGATGVPFQIIRNILLRSRSELLLRVCLRSDHYVVSCFNIL